MGNTWSIIGLGATPPPAISANAAAMPVATTVTAPAVAVPSTVLSSAIPRPGEMVKPETPSTTIAAAAIESRPSDDIPLALALAFATRNCDPFNGLPYPLEATRLIIKSDDGRLVMSWTNREVWSLVGGLSKSIPPDGGTQFSDFRPPIDPRYTKDGKQFPPGEQEKIVVESPLRGLMREAEEELTSDKYAEFVSVDTILRDAPKSAVPLILDKIRNGRWTSVVAIKSNARVSHFKSYVCLCCIALTAAEIAQLNTEIDRFPDREHMYFEQLAWEIRTHTDSTGRVVKKIHVKCDVDTHLRAYDKDVVFGLYAESVIALLT